MAEVLEQHAGHRRCMPAIGALLLPDTASRVALSRASDLSLALLEVTPDVRLPVLWRQGVLDTISATVCHTW